MVAGALPKAQRAAIANHAASCVPCHALLEGLIDAGVLATADASQRSARGDGLAADNLVLERGTRVGRYAIEEPLGAGGMSVVYAAFDTELHRRVAVKLLRPDHQHLFGSDGGDGSDHLLSEARALARLSHPNVVTLFDIGTYDGQLFLAMELIAGGSLRMWLRHAPRKADEILDRLLDAGRGLAAAHAASVVHRDVKPDNILIGVDGNARVTDFGLAQIVTGVTADPSGVPTQGSMRSRLIVGTPAYMAPEQLVGAEPDARSDQWSFCVTLYEALAGVRAFTLDDRAARAAAISHGWLTPAAPGRHVPDWVQNIVARGVCADPSARWPSMEAVVVALELGRRRHGLATAIVNWVPRPCGIDCAPARMSRSPAR